MPHFSLNGETHDVDHTEFSIRALLERFELTGKRVAVAINSNVVPRSSFDDVFVADGDKVEVIQAVGGGSR